MASYVSPTIIQPAIPYREMTSLEKLILSQMFTAEPFADGLRFFAETTINDMPEFDLLELQVALYESTDTQSAASDFVRACLEKLDVEGDTPVTLDMSIFPWEYIFQHIVRRSSTLSYVTAISTFTSSKMRVDGFGGLAVLVTEKEVRGKSLEDVLTDLIDQARASGEIAKDVS